MITESTTERFRAETFWTKEPETLVWIQSFADGETLFDVGANVGIYSLYCAAIHPGCHIHGFEPDAKNFARLKDNIALNAFAEITPHQIAVSDVNGRRMFRPASSQIGSSGGQIEAQSPPHAVHYGVKVRTLDALSANIGVPQHIKIDIDGQELRVVRGMGGLLHKPQLQSILIEIDLQDMQAMTEIITRFAAAGFTPEKRFNRMETHSRVRRAREGILVENIIFTRGT